MTLSSRQIRTRLAGASRAFATVAFAAGLVLALPFAIAQEESAPTEGAEAPAAGPAREGAPEPGTESAVTATGWGGAQAKVLHVEGATDGAPLRAADKPRPQNDWFVQRLQRVPPPSLNPIATDRPETSQISRYVLGKLLVVDPDAPPGAIGSLAVTWNVENQGRTCTYTLRKGVQFADGRPFTSADVIFSFAALRDPAVSAEHMRAEFDSIVEMTAPDAHTVVVKFADKSWKSPYVIGRALPILNKGWYEEQLPLFAQREGLPEVSATPGERGFSDAFNRMPGLCPGTGPYHLAAESAITGTRVDLVPNPFSWEQQVHPTRHNFAGLRWVTLPTEGDAFHAFVHGELDVWVVSHAAWEHQLSRDPRVDKHGRHYVYDHIGLDCSMIVWNCRKAPFDDKNVRRAMTFLTDRDEILYEVDQGHGAVASCKSKRGYPSYTSALKPLPHDHDQAEAHLIRAGWFQDTDDDGVLDKNGKPFSFELTYPAGRRNFDLIAELIQKDYRRVGIDVRLNPVGPEGFHRAVRSRRFDAIVGYSQWPDPWIDLYGRYHKSQDNPGGGNVCGWRNQRADELLEAMRTELDDDARTQLHHEFNTIFLAEQPETLLTHGKVGVLLSKRMKAASVRPTGLQTFDLWVHPDDVLHAEIDSK